MGTGAWLLSRILGGKLEMKRFAIVTTACAAVALGMTFSAGNANAAGGTISGTVKSDGPAPKPKTLEVTKDKEVCGLKPHLDEDLAVGDGGGIQNAVGVVKGAKGDLRPQPLTFGQRVCLYEPHVLAFPAGSTVKIINSDGILHNIHPYSTANPAFNAAQPKFKIVIQRNRR